MNVIVVGGGKVGFYLVRALLEHGHRVAVIEKDPERCQTIAEEYPVLVVSGDGTNPAALLDAGADRADVLASVTGKDEENLLVCQIAKRRFQIGKVIARVNNPKNQEVFGLLGIDLVVSSTGIIAEMIEREIMVNKLRTVLTFHHGNMEIVEADITPHSPAAHRKVVDLAPYLPKESVLVAVLRNAHVIAPRGDTVIEPGDTVVAMGPTGAVAVLNQVLAGER